jgi:hypothetical protein
MHGPCERKKGSQGKVSSGTVGLRSERICKRQRPKAKRTRHDLFRQEKGRDKTNIRHTTCLVSSYQNTIHTLETRDKYKTKGRRLELELELELGLGLGLGIS